MKKYNLGVLYLSQALEANTKAVKAAPQGIFYLIGLSSQFKSSKLPATVETKSRATKRADVIGLLLSDIL
mgnify:CR=1 FL=1